MLPSRSKSTNTNSLTNLKGENEKHENSKMGTHRDGSLLNYVADRCFVRPGCHGRRGSIEGAGLAAAAADRRAIAQTRGIYESPGADPQRQNDRQTNAAGCAFAPESIGTVGRHHPAPDSSA